MCLLLESIRIVDGEWMNLAYHRHRMEISSKELFGITVSPDFEAVEIPVALRRGVVKCRVLYDAEVREVGFEAYVPRKINSLRLVYDDRIDYHLKWADRSALNVLLSQKGEADDVLIVKSGWVTDISYANVVLRFGDKLVTPVHCLLKGTRRQQLLDQGVIVEQPISVEDLCKADSVIIINAMLGIEDGIEIPVNRIFK